MAEPCFTKKGSNPAVCGLHNERLVKKQLPDEMIASGYKGFAFLTCPVSGAVLDDEKRELPRDRSKRKLSEWRKRRISCQ
jgi:hypothetical protein